MEGVRPTVGDTRWFTHDRFGLFIHWGLYALPARHEWVKHRERLTNEAYEKYFTHFDPDLYNPDEWAQVAKDAGMKYFVVTTKHHEGFCLWDSQLTDYKATNTPAGRDLIRPMVEAFRKQGLRVGFYYSLIDWHHPDFVIDDMHPLRGHPDREALNAGRDPKRYIAYLHGQVRELLTQYGRIDTFFFDFSYPSRPGWLNERGEPFVGKGRADWDSMGLIRLVRELMPDVVVNDRLDLDDLPEGWDYRTPEQYLPAGWVRVNGQPVVWETCQTFSGSWGYHRDEESWKSVEQLVQMLIDVVSKGGNLLLNVGPTGRGEFDARALDRLSGIGQWMKRHSRSIYGCTAAPEAFPTPQDCRLTYHPERKRLYVHVFCWPFQHLHLPGFAGKVEYAQLLHDASEVGLTEHTGTAVHGHMTEALPPDTLTLTLPVKKPDTVVPVIELFLK
ncbi:MAG: alpha-L-fucosidase [Chloroherpetonaceae bacterium]|nr:alpha-L-fucosidase [Chloroherpetonaceae bacterium]